MEKNLQIAASKNSLTVASAPPKLKVAFIIGNGFNFLIQSIIKNIPNDQVPKQWDISKDEIAASLGEITVLWKKFDELLSDLRQAHKTVNDEELIRMIYTVIDFLSSIEAFEKVLTKDRIETLKETFDFLLIERIREIAEEFRNHETNQGGYKDLKKLFPEFGQDFKNIMDKHQVESCDFFTTNYDGVLDTMLTGAKKGYLSVDGFGIHPDPQFKNYLRLYSDSLSYSPRRCIHIHGSYKFEKKYGDTYKARSSNGENLDPVIIFNNPELKESLIRRDPVLSYYYSFMADSLQEADKLIIIGNSMTNEPHLKALIQKKFNRSEQKLYVCSRNPSEIADQLKGIYYRSPIQRKTNDIATIQELLDFLESIIID